MRYIFKAIPFKRLLPLLGFLILFFIFSQVNLQQVLELWVISSKKLIIVAVIMLFLQLLIITFKWFVLIDDSVSFWQTFKIRMIGAFFGTITPANAGTLVQAHYLKQASSISIGKASSSVVVDKLLEITAVASLSLISVIALSSKLLSEKNNLIFLFIAIVSFLLSLMLAIWMVTDKKNGKNILKKLSKYILPTKLYIKIKPFFLKIHPHIHSIKSLPLPFLLNMLSYASSYVYILLLVWAIGADLSYYQIFITLPLSSLVALLPITLSGIGTREATTIFLWNIFGVTAEQTVSVMLLSFVIGRGLPTFLGWFFLTTFKKKTSQTSSHN